MKEFDSSYSFFDMLNLPNDKKYDCVSGFCEVGDMDNPTYYVNENPRSDSWVKGKIKDEFFIVEEEGLKENDVINIVGRAKDGSLDMKFVVSDGYRMFSREGMYDLTKALSYASEALGVKNDDLSTLTWCLTGASTERAKKQGMELLNKLSSEGAKLSSDQVDFMKRFESNPKEKALIMGLLGVENVADHLYPKDERSVKSETVQPTRNSEEKNERGV